MRLSGLTAISPTGRFVVYGLCECASTVSYYLLDTKFDTRAYLEQLLTRNGSLHSGNVKFHFSTDEKYLLSFSGAKM